MGVGVKRGDDRLGVFGFGGDDVAGLDGSAVLNLGLAAVKFDAGGFASLWGDGDDVVVAVFVSFDEAVDWGDPSLTLRVAGFEKLFDARETASDGAGASDAGAVFGVERELGARFTERLSGDDADRLVGFDEFAGGHVDAVSLARDAVYRGGREDGLDFDGFDFVVGFELGGDFWGDELVGL